MLNKVKKSFKYLFIAIDYGFMVMMNRISYTFYLKNFPKHLRRRGVKFTGDIKNTGFIGYNVKFDSLAYCKYIEIGENTIISSDVFMLAHDYSIATAIRTVRPVTKGDLPHVIKPIKIGNNVFIGARVIILPGTTIGDNTIIGSGAVIKGNIPAGSVVAGNPAKVIMTTEECAKRHLEKNDFIERHPQK